MNNATANASVTGETTITIGYVMVYTTQEDCNGMRRTIDFPRLGNYISRNAQCHWTVKRLVPQALKVARKAISDFAKK